MDVRFIAYNKNPDNNNNTCGARCGMLLAGAGMDEFYRRMADVKLDMRFKRKVRPASCGVVCGTALAEVVCARGASDQRRLVDNPSPERCTYTLLVGFTPPRNPSTIAHRCQRESVCVN